MSVESNLQTEIIQFLRKNKCYVIKTRPGAGTPKGCPDIIFMYEGFWGAIEVKNSQKARYQPLQKETLDRLNAWSWARRVDPSNWGITKAELEQILQ